MCHAAKRLGCVDCLRKPTSYDEMPYWCAARLLLRLLQFIQTCLQLFAASTSINHQQQFGHLQLGRGLRRVHGVLQQLRSSSTRPLHFARLWHPFSDFGNVLFLCELRLASLHALLPLELSDELRLVRSFVTPGAALELNLLVLLHCGHQSLVIGSVSCRALFTALPGVVGTGRVFRGLGGIPSTTSSNRGNARRLAAARLAVLTFNFLSDSTSS
jgi:hypothetical protein